MILLYYDWELWAKQLISTIYTFEIDCSSGNLKSKKSSFSNWDSKLKTVFKDETQSFRSHNCKEQMVFSQNFEFKVLGLKLNS